MLLAQLAAFLTHHHHAAQAAGLPTDPGRVVEHWLAWARRHGFTYQP